MNTVRTTRKTLCDIAQFSFSIVNDWLSRDQRLARELRSITTSSRQIVGEEAITVDLATRLRDHFPKHVEVILFTHPEETQIGADWYWRFERGDHAIHARVQAKRVQRIDFNTPDSDGFIDIDLNQLNQLLKATRTAEKQLPGLEAWLATYARFDATPPCGCIDLQKCTMHQHGIRCDNHQPSLWIGNGQDFKDMNVSRASVIKIVQKSLRLDCVLPCIDASGVKTGPAEKDFSLRAGLPSFRNCVAIIQNDVQLRPEFQGALRIY